MNPMDPVQLIFNAVGSLTGGLINDLTSAVLALVTLGFIAMGFDYLKDLLEIGVGGPMHSINKARTLWHTARLNRSGISGAGLQAPDGPRRDVEISPLRKYDLDLAYRGVDSLPGSPNSIYDQKQNTWERDGIELSSDRLAELEDAYESNRSRRDDRGY